ncbi:hypothetical protein [Pseudomonas sp. JR33AA]|uniref:hypothetical protein n=1 Tax=Pseudomonas sp. JR33AA TaxID=2899113 RepID=UPI001F37ED6F|nr:hypothetical protein [Pseudomonas sp. JR33AA]MCE5979040.1 hypothetical protein [Pseudomonas sp. JR33AA]
MTDPRDVEQLREVIKHSDAQILRQSMRISNQRAQLAERDALLKEVLIKTDKWMLPDLYERIRLSFKPASAGPEPAPRKRTSHHSPTWMTLSKRPAAPG